MSWFSGKKAKNIVSDKVWVSEKYKSSGIIEDCRNKKQDQIMVFVYFFTNTGQHLKDYFQTNNLRIKEIDRSMYDDLSYDIFIIKADIIETSDVLVQFLKKYETREINICFLEHYPLFIEEEKVLDKICSIPGKIPEVVFYSSLDEPLYQIFGGDRIIDITSKLGLSEGEFIQHTLISNSITNAQKKIEKQIRLENKTSSAKDWFLFNNISGLS